MPIHRARQRFSDQYVSIVLTVISIIQGLTFSDLIGNLPAIYSYTRASGNYCPLAHFCLSFVLLLRVFQTYVSAAIEYDEMSVNFFDVLLIFVAGGIQHFIFATLAPAGFNVMQYHKRFSLLSFFGILGYMRALGMIKREGFTYSDYVNERSLQRVNLAGVVCLQALSILIIFLAGRTQALCRWLPLHPGSQALHAPFLATHLWQSHATHVFTVCAVVATLLLGFNIYYSLHCTFKPRPVETRTGSTVQPVGSSSPNAATHVDVRPALPADAEAICRLLVQEFGYEFMALFDTSARLTERMLRRLMVYGGPGAWGYARFHVAVCRQDKTVVGALMCLEAERTPLLPKVYGHGLYGGILLSHLGLIGAARSLCNARLLCDTMPVPEPEEVRIRYVIVEEKRRRHKIGTQLIQHTMDRAQRKGKTVVRAEVRERNGVGQCFLRGSGFKQTREIAGSSDVILGQGCRFRLEKALVTPAPTSPPPATVSGKPSPKSASKPSKPPSAAP